MKNDAGICVVHLNANTTIWRGEIFHDPTALRLGDDVGARAIVSYPTGELTAEEVEANVAKAEGTIVALRPDRIFVKEDRVRGRVTVLFDSHTEFNLERGKLEKGAIVLAIGLQPGHNTFRATSIAIEK